MCIREPGFAFFRVAICAVLLICPLLRAQTRNSQYVGSDSCVACHEDVAGKIAESAHGKLAGESTPSRRGCEGCHGPGSNHVNSGGDKSLLFSFKDASAEAIRGRCGSCHETESGSVHSQHTTNCLSCHAAHRYRQTKFILAQAPPQLCTDCHDRRH